MSSTKTSYAICDRNADKVITKKNIKNEFLLLLPTLDRILKMLFPFLSFAFLDLCDISDEEDEEDEDTMPILFSLDILK